jgi:hypothetical protein
MKKLVLIVVVALVASVSTINTSTAQGISVELDFSYNQPGGDFADIYKGGVGVAIHPRFNINGKMAVGLNVGANGFIGGDFNDVNNPSLDTEISAAGIVNVLGTVQYKLLDKKITPYGELGVGMFKSKSADTSSLDANGDPEIVDESHFGFAPKVGAMLGFLNVYAQYISAGDLKYTQFGLGFRFGKK